MAMKKKFLGLAMAAMVALPAAAYADTFRWDEGQSQNVDVTVTGSVKSSTGIAPQGKLEVELPVSMEFSVDQNGTFTGTSYNVTNKSQSNIGVSVANFSETNAQGGINILSISDKDSIAEKGRENVIMALVGDNNQYVDLGDFNANKGTEILTVKGNNGVGTIELTGLAGKAAIGTNSPHAPANGVDNNAGVAETFKLVFQITKK